MDEVLLPKQTLSPNISAHEASSRLFHSLDLIEACDQEVFSALELFYLQPSDFEGETGALLQHVTNKFTKKISVSNYSFLSHVAMWVMRTLEQWEKQLERQQKQNLRNSSAQSSIYERIQSRMKKPEVFSLVKILLSCLSASQQRVPEADDLFSQLTKLIVTDVKGQKQKEELDWLLVLLATVFPFKIIPPLFNALLFKTLSFSFLCPSPQPTQQQQQQQEEEWWEEAGGRLLGVERRLFDFFLSGGREEEEGKTSLGGLGSFQQSSVASLVRRALEELLLLLFHQRLTWAELQQYLPWSQLFLSGQRLLLLSVTTDEEVTWSLLHGLPPLLVEEKVAEFLLKVSFLLPSFDRDLVAASLSLFSPSLLLRLSRSSLKVSPLPPPQRLSTQTQEEKREDGGKGKMAEVLLRLLLRRRLWCRLGEDSLAFVLLLFRLLCLLPPQNPLFPLAASSTTTGAEERGLSLAKVVELVCSGIVSELDEEVFFSLNQKVPIGREEGAKSFGQGQAFVVSLRRHLFVLCQLLAAFPQQTDTPDSSHPSVLSELTKDAARQGQQRALDFLTSLLSSVGLLAGEETCLLIQFHLFGLVKLLDDSALETLPGALEVQKSFLRLRRLFAGHFPFSFVKAVEKVLRSLDSCPESTLLLLLENLAFLLFHFLQEDALSSLSRKVIKVVAKNWRSYLLLLSHPNEEVEERAALLLQLLAQRHLLADETERYALLQQLLSLFFSSLIKRPTSFSAPTSSSSWLPEASTSGVKVAQENASRRLPLLTFLITQVGGSSGRLREVAQDRVVEAVFSTQADGALQADSSSVKKLPPSQSLAPPSCFSLNTSLLDLQLSLLRSSSFPSSQTEKSLLLQNYQRKRKGTRNTPLPPASRVKPLSRPLLVQYRDSFLLHLLKEENLVTNQKAILELLKGLLVEKPASAYHSLTTIFLRFLIPIPKQYEQYQESCAKRPPLERNSFLQKMFATTPLLMSILNLIAEVPTELIRCIDVLKGLLAISINKWHSELGTNTTDCQLFSFTCELMEIFRKGKLVPTPLCNCGELFAFISPSDVKSILMTVWEYLKDLTPSTQLSFMERLNDRRREKELFSPASQVLRHRIDTLSPFYLRFSDILS